MAIQYFGPFELRRSFFVFFLLILIFKELSPFRCFSGFDQLRKRPYLRSRSRLARWVVKLFLTQKCWLTGKNDWKRLLRRTQSPCGSGLEI